VEIKKDFKEMGINKGEFYLFYPLKQQIVISFGENAKGRLGMNGASFGPKMVSSTKELKCSKVSSAFNHSVVVDHEGLLWRTG
jgi:alpha-tubulin suppressor-like RCC1 family protein